jgi:hypothetical protein
LGSAFHQQLDIISLKRLGEKSEFYDVGDGHYFYAMTISKIPSLRVSPFRRPLPTFFFLLPAVYYYYAVPIRLSIYGNVLFSSLYYTEYSFFLL